MARIIAPCCAEQAGYSLIRPKVDLAPIHAIRYRFADSRVAREALHVVSALGMRDPRREDSYLEVDSFQFFDTLLRSIRCRHEVSQVRLPLRSFAHVLVI